MECGKRSAADMDPDYEDITAQQAKRQKLLENDAKEATIRKIEIIVQAHCDEGYKDLSRMLDQVDQEFHSLRHEVDRLRARIVAHYYQSAGQDPLTKTNQSPHQQQLTTSIHPAVKKLLGKTPKILPSISCDHYSDMPVKEEFLLESSSSFTSQFISQDQTKQLSTSSSSSTYPDDNGPVDPITLMSASNEQNDSGRGSRFKIKQKILVGHVSRYIPSETREDNDHSTHKWLIYVRGPKNDPNIEPFVRKVRFFLHPSYRPNDLVEICQFPFHLCRRGWGEFPIRVQIHFKDPRNKPIDIIHFLTLDKTCTGLHTIGGETQVEVELEKFCIEESLSRSSTPILQDTIDIDGKHQTISHSFNIKPDPDNLSTSSILEGESTKNTSDEDKQHHNRVSLSQTDEISSLDDFYGASDSNSTEKQVIMPPLGPFLLPKTESKTCNTTSKTTATATPVNYSQMPPLSFIVPEKTNLLANNGNDIKDETDIPQTIIFNNIPKVNHIISSNSFAPTKVSSASTSTITVCNSLNKPAMAVTMSNGTLMLTKNLPSSCVQSDNADKSQGPVLQTANNIGISSIAGTNVSGISGRIAVTQMSKISSPSPVPISINTSPAPRAVTTFIKCTDKSGNVFLIPESSLIRAIPPPVSISSTSVTAVRPTISAPTISLNLATPTASQHSLLTSSSSSSTVCSTTMSDLSQIPIVKPEGNSATGVMPQSSGQTFILKLVPNPAAMKSITNQIVFLPTSLTGGGSLGTVTPVRPKTLVSNKIKCEKKPQVLITEIKKPSLTNSSSNTWNAKKMGTLSVQNKSQLNKAINQEIKVRLECLASMEHLVKSLVKKHPIVLSEPDPTIRPYCAKSISTFMSWNIGKRRASEWQRAASIRRCIVKLLNSSDRFKDESIWTTKQIVWWCRQHGFTPLDIVEIDSLPSDHSFRNSSGLKFLSISDSQELQDRLSVMKQSQTASNDGDNNIEVDIINLNLAPLVKVKDEPQESSYPRWFCLPPTSPAVEYIQESAEQIGIRFDATEVSPQVFAPVVEEVLLAATREFMEDILRKSLAHASQKYYVVGRTPSSISAQDVYNGIQILPNLDFLSNKYMGIAVREPSEEEEAEAESKTS